MELTLSSLGYTEFTCPLHVHPNNWINLFYSLTGDAQSQGVNSANWTQIQTQEDTAAGLTWSGSVTIPPNSLWISLQLRKPEAGYMQELMPNRKGNLHALHGMGFYIREELAWRIVTNFLLQRKVSVSLSPLSIFFNSFACSSTDSVRLGEKVLNFKAKLVSLLVINKANKNNEGY